MRISVRNVCLLNRPLPTYIIHIPTYVYGAYKICFWFLCILFFFSFRPAVYNIQSLVRCIVYDTLRTTFFYCCTRPLVLHHSACGLSAIANVYFVCVLRRDSVCAEQQRR